MTTSSITFTLYSRRGCPACEELLAELEMGVFPKQFNVEVVDIDSNPQLVKEYGMDIPVLMVDGVELGRHEVDLQLVSRYLKERT